MRLLIRADDIVICGNVGLITPLGDTQLSWEAFREGRSGIKVIELFNFDPKKAGVQIAGQIDRAEFDPEFLIRIGNIFGEEAAKGIARKRIDYFSRFGLDALCQALGMRETLEAIQRTVKPERTGVCFGTGIGGVRHLQDISQDVIGGLKRRHRPLRTAIEMLPDRLAALVSMLTNAQGPKECNILACATGAAALMGAARMVTYGEADLVYSGASEAAVTEAGVACFMTLTALTTKFNDDPQRASRPFDEKHSGFVISEGAGSLIVTTRRVAEACGLPILARILGWANTSDAWDDTNPTPEGPARAISLALAMAKITPTEIDMISAHGTSTPANDANETLAYKMALKGAAYDTFVSALKSMIGHTLGAAGMIASGATVLSILDGVVPPTINFEKEAEGCDLNYTPNVAVCRPVRTALVTAFGFGGHNVALVLQAA